MSAALYTADMSFSPTHFILAMETEIRDSISFSSHF